MELTSTMSCFLNSIMVEQTLEERLEAHSSPPAMTMMLQLTNMVN